MKNLRVPVFNPVLINLPGPLAISWYGLMYLLGLLFIYIFVTSHIKRGKITLKRVHFIEILTRVFIGVLVGGRLGYVFFVDPANFLRNPLQIFAIWEGGMYFFGGFIAAIVIPLFYMKKHKLNFFDVADLIIIPVPMALAFGRLGNFINGEFWGKPSASPLAMVFDSVQMWDWFPVSTPWVQEIVDATGMSVTDGRELVNLPRHPVQLYELVLEGVLLYALLHLFRNIGPPKPRGSVFSLFLIAYGAFRFWIEFYRNPESHSRYLAGDWFTLGMLFSIPMVLIGIFGLVFAYRKQQTNKLYKH